MIRMEKKLKPEQILIEQIEQWAKKQKEKAYLVGGYIRDHFRRRRTRDIDIVVEGDALSFARAFSRVYRYPAPIFYGKFGTAMIEIEGIKLEFATARKESYHALSRKPQVNPTTILEDLTRRDFTINAIAYDLLEKKYLDPFNGKKDIKEKVIRTPVSPDKTFFDDPLRILRGIRFASHFSFSIDPHTFKGMANNAHRLSIVSIERISDELIKTLSAPLPGYGFSLMEQSGVLALILPEVANLREEKKDLSYKELFEHTLQVLDNLSQRTKDPYLRLTGLLHDIGKPKTFRKINGKVSFHRHEFVGERMAKTICERLKIPADKTEMIRLLIRYHLRPHLLAKEDPTDNALARFIREIGKNMKELFLLAESDLTSKNKKKVMEAQDSLNALHERIKALNKKRKLARFSLKLDGFLLMETLEIPPGPQVGIIKQYLEERVLDGLVENKKRALLSYVKRYHRELLGLNADSVQKKKNESPEENIP